jgi:hypothetical protein
MNSSPTEEVGKAVSGIVEGLKAQPAVLSLTVILIGMLIWMFYALNSAANFRNIMLTQQADYQKYVTEILSRCVVPRSGADYRVQSDRTEIIPLPPLRPVIPQQEP